MLVYSAPEVGQNCAQALEKEEERKEVVVAIFGLAKSMPKWCVISNMLRQISCKMLSFSSVTELVMQPEPAHLRVKSNSQSTSLKRSWDNHKDHFDEVISFIIG